MKMGLANWDHNALEIIHFLRLCCFDFFFLFYPFSYRYLLFIIITVVLFLSQYLITVIDYRNDLIGRT